MDYCGIYSCGNAAGGTTNETEKKREVRLRFLRDELLYDIKNYAYVESDVMGEESQHAQHVLAFLPYVGKHMLCMPT